METNDDETSEQILARIERETEQRHAELMREVATYEGALAWLERVGSWPSSDPAIRKITAAAEKRLARGRL